MTYDVDVIVAGAGPVGLMLAGELRLGGASVIVVERLAEIDPTVKAGSLNAPTVEALDRRGLLPGLRAAQERNMEQFAAFMRQRSPAGPAGGAASPTGPPTGPPAKPPPRFAGHFAGIMLAADLI